MDIENTTTKQLKNLINNRKTKAMSKIHISPEMIAQIVKGCETSEDIKNLLSLVKKYAHPYQIGWIKNEIHKKEIQEQKQQQETK